MNFGYEQIPSCLWVKQPYNIVVVNLDIEIRVGWNVKLN